MNPEKIIDNKEDLSEVSAVITPVDPSVRLAELNAKFENPDGSFKGFNKIESPIESGLDSVRLEVQELSDSLRALSGILKDREDERLNEYLDPADVIRLEKILNEIPQSLAVTDLTESFHSIEEIMSEFADESDRSIDDVDSMRQVLRLLINSQETVDTIRRKFSGSDLKDSDKELFLTSSRKLSETLEEAGYRVRAKIRFEEER